VTRVAALAFLVLVCFATAADARHLFGGGAAPIRIVLTTASASPWTVPANWNSAHNTIEVVGDGGGGGTGSGFDPAAGGGGGSVLDGNSTSIIGLPGGSGATGSEWGAYGCGGGGGGAAGAETATATGQGGDAGNYGCGGAGSGTTFPASAAGRGGNGAPSLIVITYVP
jgi:hypothetical protein